MRNPTATIKNKNFNLNILYNILPDHQICLGAMILDISHIKHYHIIQVSPAER